MYLLSKQKRQPYDENSQVAVTSTKIFAKKKDKQQPQSSLLTSFKRKPQLEKPACSTSSDSFRARRFVNPCKQSSHIKQQRHIV